MRLRGGGAAFFKREQNWMGRWIAGALLALGLTLGALFASSSADTSQQPILDTFAAAQ
jgi:hypothetical protein